MGQLEESVLNAMRRMAEKVESCDPHMFVFPASEHTIRTWTREGVEVLVEGPVMLVCRPVD